MRWIDASPENCPVGLAADVVGERWTLLVVRDALNGIFRFDDLRAHLGMSDAVLSDRLRKLVDAGILERRPYQVAGQRTRQGYHPTAKGRALMTVMLALREWGEEHLADPARPAFVARHRTCEGPVSVDLRCDDHPERPVPPGDVEVVPGPGARPAGRQ